MIRSRIEKEWTTKSKTGIRTYHITIRHNGLNEFKEIKNSNKHVAKEMANAAMTGWNGKWGKKIAAENEKKLKEQEKLKEKQYKENRKQKAAEETKKAKNALDILKNTLNIGLNTKPKMIWEQSYDYSEFPTPKPVKDRYLRMMPEKPQLIIYSKPKQSDSKYNPKLSFLDKISSERKHSKLDHAKQLYLKDLEIWKARKLDAIARFDKKKVEYKQEGIRLFQLFQKDVKEWQNLHDKFIKEQKRKNDGINALREEYRNHKPFGVKLHFGMVLNRSKYPDYFPKKVELEYNPDNKILIVDYQIPAPDIIPRLVEVKYVLSQDEFREVMMSEVQFNKLYDDLIYQIALRNIHELYKYDKASALDSIVFNGFVHSIDPATGKEKNSYLLSLLANREDFLKINLESVDPKTCFKKLKGVACAQLNTITPVAPLMQLNRNDSRFVNSYDVADSINEGDNLALMNWKDFEHLIRELFEKEFSSGGGEVKITQASKDGGVDAVAFDPDPIKGGKIIIQAKRYTNTVGVSAVRDLYGTVMNEGANKGILVTTSSYGSDAYKFANDKPLTLLDGGNLLHMLEKHGHRAKIDIKEAREMIKQQSLDS
ncbi:EcoKMrr [Limihaloglobus sulfuriphilus]|uniref:EcoKMrr n=1 Tax=Limihaloglobus sulfuriphilus TaxID=1851148 RepID=A0A1Q2MAI5_9BACT|nr:restriction endonuclease [Limihaloglobus sulfuriphilus]AQQ69684.1 EcoKMrr [Limihaloglobus sulfuriphilus]